MEKGTEYVTIENIQGSVRETVVRQYVYYRKLKNLTQADVAQRASISRTNVTRFESEKYNPSLEMLVKIAYALDMDLEFRLVEKDKEGENDK